jgi:DNA-binding MarR family transcriptional regulator
VELGLLDEEREAEGRRRRVYTLTAAGRKALDDWRREPTSEQPQIRDAGLLKLFFGNGMSPDEIRALAHAQEEAHLARLDVYEAKAATVTNPNHAAVVRAGLLHERTFAEFWREISATPP